jgi:hypothetical protein
LQIASPACTELEVVMLDWLGKMLELPKEFLASSGGKGGGVIQVTLHMHLNYDCQWMYNSLSMSNSFICLEFLNFTSSLRNYVQS